MEKEVRKYAIYSVIIYYNTRNKLSNLSVTHLLKITENQTKPELVVETIFYYRAT